MSICGFSFRGEIATGTLLAELVMVVISLEKPVKKR
jgi:hypothetical protein